jgi:hypothetical protein
MVQMVMPRMAYEITGWQYDASRKLTSTGRTVQALTTSNSVLKAQFNPVPYNFGFSLHIGAKNVEDGLMILEQILPFFTPDYTITTNDMPELDLQKDIVIVHEGAVTPEDSYDGAIQERRIITWTLQFTVKGYLYPPVKLNRVVLETDIYYNIDGGVNEPSLLPSYGTTVTPDDTLPNEPNIQTTDTRLDTSVVLVVSPSTFTMASGASKTFMVTIVNALDTSFVANVPVTDNTDADTYSVDTANNRFIYNAGAGRTEPETLVIDIVSVEDPKRKKSITLTINP